MRVAEHAIHELLLDHSFSLPEVQLRLGWDVKVTRHVFDNHGCHWASLLYHPPPQARQLVPRKLLPILQDGRRLRDFDVLRTSADGAALVVRYVARNRLARPRDISHHSFVH